MDAVRSATEVLGEPGIERDGADAQVSRLRNALATLLISSYERHTEDARDVDGESVVAGSVARILPSRDLVVKRMACTLLTRWPNVGPLVYNTLSKDCADANPLIRSIALRTVLHRSFVALRDPDATRDLLIRGLDDASAHVRRAAVLGCVRVATDESPDPPSSKLASGDLFADRLYAMLRDSDPLVVADCLTALDELLDAEGGVVVNRGIVRHLLSRMAHMSDFDVIRILNVLRRRYVPDSDDDKFHLMDSMDVLLRRSNCASVFETIGLFVDLVGVDGRMRSHVFRRVAPRISEFLVDDSNPEIRYLWLRFIRDNVESFEGTLSLSTAGLRCEYAEPDCIGMLKIEIAVDLTVLGREEAAARTMLDELFAHSTDRSDAVSACAVRAIGRLRAASSRVAILCTDALLRLLAVEHRDATTAAILSTLCLSDMAGFVEQNPINRSLCASRLRAVLRRRSRSTSAETDGALVRLIGAHAHLLDDGPYLLEELMNGDTVVSSSEDLGEALLVAGLRMLFARPAEMQTIFGRYAEQCLVGGGNGRLAERVRFYYGLLRGDPDLAKRILDSEN